MDKYEYKVRAEEIKALISEGEFVEAVKIADTIDWRRVKSVMMLCTISDLYKINRRFQESKDVLLMAYERHPGGRLIVYSLCELSIKMGEFVQAIEYYKEFVQIAPKDTGRYILQYKLYEAQDVSLEERIAVLEEFKKRDYREKWAYELAYLYHRVGLQTKCVEECDEMILWFGEGRYVMKALELKSLHQPLTPIQQEKYSLLIEEKERKQKRHLAEETPAEPEENDQGQIVDFTSHKTEEPVEEEEFRVKTVDVGQYNTINLQKELAQSMKEILGEDAFPENQPHLGKPNLEEPKEELTLDEVTRSIVAPLSQKQETIAPVNKMTELPQTILPQASELEQEIIPEPSVSQPSTEEVFFEDIKDFLLEDTKELDTEQINSSNIHDTKEINPKKKIIYPTTAALGGKAASFATDVSAPKNDLHPTHGPHLMKTTKPSGFEQMLSQEYDGQIKLVVPEDDLVEKQITGQMNITDIMAEWEQMKRENEEKRREDVRNRVQEHTGNMFSDFDEATKTGLLEQLEKAVVEAILKEAGEKSFDPGIITPQKVSDIVHSVEKQNMEEQKNKEIAAEESVAEDVTAEESIAEEAAIAVEQKTDETETVNPVASEKNSSESTDLETVSLEETPSEGITLEELQSSNKIKNIVEDTNRLRPLSEEEKELFNRFIHNKKAKEQVIHSIDTMSMDPYTDNVIITGEEGVGTLDLAKNLIRMLQMSDSNFSGKVAKISGATLKKKNVQETVEKLADGALIIEKATEMSSATATDLNEALSRRSQGLFVIMEGKRDEMNIFMRKNFVLAPNFNARIDIEALNDHALVEFAKQYAEEMEYSIDELGILALHTRIADMQTSDHEVTVEEVIELVDDAIYFADKKNLKHFFDILLGNRYDEEDMIVLREKDFMHY